MYFIEQSCNYVELIYIEINTQLNYNGSMESIHCFKLELVRRVSRMTTCAKVFSDLLDEKEIKYRVINSNRIIVGIYGDNLPNQDITFIFNDEDTDVGIRAFSIVKVPETKKGAAIASCEVLNMSIRFIKFCIDQDNDLNAEIDAIIEPYTAGKICFNHLVRLTEILKKVYPIIMNAIWGGASKS